MIRGTTFSSSDSQQNTWLNMFYKENGGGRKKKSLCSAGIRLLGMAQIDRKDDMWIGSMGLPLRFNNNMPSVMPQVGSGEAWVYIVRSLTPTLWMKTIFIAVRDHYGGRLGTEETFQKQEDHLKWAR